VSAPRSFFLVRLPNCKDLLNVWQNIRSALGMISMSLSVLTCPWDIQPHGKSGRAQTQLLNWYVVRREHQVALEQAYIVFMMAVVE
jgi:hypothetical protein